MTDERWNPYDQATRHLDRYTYFFRRDDVDDTEVHPQVVEDFLDMNCPKDYCYAWVWAGDGIGSSGKIVDSLIGVPDHVAMALKLITGLDAFTPKKKGYATKITYKGQHKIYLPEKY